MCRGRCMLGVSHASWFGSRPSLSGCVVSLTFALALIHTHLLCVWMCGWMYVCLSVCLSTLLIVILSKLVTTHHPHKLGGGSRIFVGCEMYPLPHATPSRKNCSIICLIIYYSLLLVEWYVRCVKMNTLKNHREKRLIMQQSNCTNISQKWINCRVITGAYS